jgi:hypothetical protein
MASLELIVVFVVSLLAIFFGLVVFIGAPYVPSQRKYVRRAFEHLGLGAKDVLVDIGSGDGVVLRIAASYGAKAVGYEINPVLVVLTRLLSLRNRRVVVKLQNTWTTTLPDDVTIIYAFAVQRDERKLQSLVQREADRLGRPLRLMCLGSPFRGVTAVETFEAYHVYLFRPLQSKKA